ncbi:MAG TPA: hypothetical protein VKA60_06660 [Blastocatellia bacterium]|nr:hypothetical protein [Blastocatellia bacterium]
MKNRTARLTARALCFLATVFALTAPIAAQSPRPQSEVDPARTRFEDTSRREMQLRGLGGNKSNDPKHVEAMVAQVKQDFERLLIRHNEIVRVLNAEQSLDLTFVSNAAAEIKKRASRLQATLALPRPADAEHPSPKPPSFEDAQMKGALFTLCKRIQSFVKNPIIVNLQTVDAQQATRARDDLDVIIALGDSINKMAERLKKNSK